MARWSRSLEHAWAVPRRCVGCVSCIAIWGLANPAPARPWNARRPNPPERQITQNSRRHKSPEPRTPKRQKTEAAQPTKRAYPREGQDQHRHPWEITPSKQDGPDTLSPPMPTATPPAHACRPALHSPSCQAPPDLAKQLIQRLNQHCSPCASTHDAPEGLDVISPNPPSMHCTSMHYPTPARPSMPSMQPEPHKATTPPSYAYTTPTRLPPYKPIRESSSTKPEKPIESNTPTSSPSTDSALSPWSPPHVSTQHSMTRQPRASPTAPAHLAPPPARCPQEAPSKEWPISPRLTASTHPTSPEKARSPPSMPGDPHRGNLPPRTLPRMLAAALQPYRRHTPFIQRNLPWVLPLALLITANYHTVT